MNVAATFPGLGVADMDMDNSRAGIRRFKSGGGDLLGCDRDGRVLADGIARAGYGTSDEDFTIHGPSFI